MNKSKLAGLISLGVLLPLGSYAKTTAQAYVESFKGTSSEMPVPLEVVEPTATARGDGLVELTFIVDAQGNPTGIAIKSATGPVQTERVKEAVAQWKFSPAKKDGAPVARKVLLPVRFTTVD